MENEYPDDELLVKYLLQELNKEEEAFVVKWIAGDEHNLQYYRELEKIWRLTAVKNTENNIDIDHEWMQFRRSVAENRSNASIMQEQVMQEDTQNEVKAIRRSVVRRLFALLAVSASVLLIIGVGWLYLDQKTKDEHAIVKEKRNPERNIISLVRHEVNATGKPKKLMLQDGSQVVLEDNSEMSFLQPFAGNRREITLQGKASFTVAKDKTKPFTVFSGAISTTVLGTVFEVTARKSSNNITVSLYEGNVVVDLVHGSKKETRKSFYLLPGYELIFDKKRDTVKIRKIYVVNALTRSKINGNNNNQDNPNVSSHNGNSWFMFNNQPLNQVLEQLKEMYNVDIIYSKADVDKLYFIGEFKKTDLFETILNQIATSNNLKVIKVNNRFIISK